MASLNRYYGSMIGLAVGDALGMPMEFRPVDTADPIRGMRPSVRFDGISREEIELPAGSWTDDTSIALCLADSILTLGSFN